MSQTLRHQPFRDNPHFAQYLGLLVQLHDAMRKGDEDAAERIREQMDGPGLHLDREEIRWMKGLSADLYMLADEEDFLPLDRSPRQLIIDIEAAGDRGDGETVLRLLRMASFISKEHRAWFRSRAYDRLGYFSLSMLFLAFTSDLAPEHQEYKYMLLAKLLLMQDFQNARTLALEIAQQSGLGTRLKILIAIALYRSVADLPEPEAAPLLQQAMQLLRSVLEEGEREALSADDELMAWLNLGACYFHLGDRESALRADDNALRIQPNNPFLLDNRGRHRLMTDRDGALDDFRAAISNHAASPFPYLYVIREELFQKNYALAGELSRSLLTFASHANARAQAFEFLAIASYGLGLPAAAINEAYQNAIRNAPDNVRVKANYEMLRAERETGDSLPHLNLPTLSEAEIVALSGGEGLPIASRRSEAATPAALHHDQSASPAFLTSFSLQSATRITQRILEEDLALAA